MKLASIYQHLHRRALASGRDQAADLFHGARIAVRVQDGETTLTISRKDKPVGDTELTTFRAHCGVPATALRWPAEGQHHTTRAGVVWHMVVFRWMELGAEEPTPGNDASAERLPMSQ